MTHQAPTADFWTDAKLDELTAIGDPEGDRLALAYLDEAGITPHSAMAAVGHHLVLPPEEQSPEIARYLADRPQYPEWVDMEKIRRSEELFGRIAPSLLWGVLCVTFPAGYAGRRPTRVLTFTGRLSENEQQAKRRIIETMGLVWDAFQPGGLDIGGPGWIDARRVRLVHALVRQVILSDPEAPHDLDGLPVWPSGWGVPISQYELLGFLETVTLAPFAYLDHFGLPLSDSQKDDLLHLWSVIGSLCGVQDELLPMTLESSAVLFAKIREREYRRSTDGIEMMRIHSEFSKSLLPRGLKGLPQTVQRAIFDEAVCDSLKIGPADWTRHLFGMMRFTTRSMWAAEHENKALAKVADWLGRKSVGVFLELERPGDHRPQFSLPDELQAVLEARGRAARMFGSASTAAKRAGAVTAAGAKKARAVGSSGARRVRSRVSSRRSKGKQRRPRGGPGSRR